MMKKLVLIVFILGSAFYASAQDAAQMINDANEALKAKEYAKAFILYDSAMKNIGDVQVNASINYNIGFAAYQAEKYQEALPYLDKAIEVGANVAKAHEYKAISYTKLNDFPNAISSYLKAIETTTEDKGNLYYNAAISAYKGNLMEDAMKLFTEAASANYKANDAYYYKSVVAKKLNLNDEYKQILIEGAEKFPTDKRITSALANLYVSEGNALYKKGVEILNAANKKVNEGSLKTTDAAYIAEIDKVKAEFKSAIEVLQKAIALDPANENAKKLIEACSQVK